MLPLASRFVRVDPPRPVLLRTPHGGVKPYEALLIAENRLGDHVTSCLLRIGTTELYVDPSRVLEAPPQAWPDNVVAFRRPAAAVAP